MDRDAPDARFDAATARLLRREAFRRAREEPNIGFPSGLEDVLARVSAEVTAEAAKARETALPGFPTDPVRKPPG